MTTWAEAKAELTAAGVNYTRRDFMDNKIEYAAYMRQFVTNAAIRLVEQHIGKQRVVDSKDPHLNDIPLVEWDALAGVRFSGPNFTGKPSAPGSRLIALSNMFTQAEQNAVPSISVSDCVGILKAAAQLIRERAKAAA